MADLFRDWPPTRIPPGGSPNGPWGRCRPCRSTCCPRGGLGLLLEALQEVLDEFVGAHVLEDRRVDAQGVGQLLWVLEPLLEEGPGHLVQLRQGRILQVHPPEGLGEDLVIAVEIALAFHQNGPGGHVEIVEGTHEAQMEGLLEAQKRGGCHGYAPVPQGVEEIDKHGPAPFSSVPGQPARPPGPDRHSS
jgi:hypothetical protein